MRPVSVVTDTTQYLPADLRTRLVAKLVHAMWPDRLTSCLAAMQVRGLAIY